MKLPLRIASSLLILCVGLNISAASDAADQPADFSPAVERVKKLVDSELERGLLTGVSVALVDDQQTVFAGGFGLADEASHRPATARTVYRAGSISKLFTATSAMQLVEQGKLDLDRPVTEYCPDFRIVDPFTDADPVSLRQLMCHRSGMFRESPVGGYFDPSGPSIAETVASLTDCVRVHPPGKVTKYSNIGVTVVGHTVGQVAGVPFAEYQRTHVLGPLGMDHSSFLRDDRVRPKLATSYMRVADSQGAFVRRESPVFELGTLPAGNLYTTAGDLARFMACLFARGSANGKQILSPETLDRMFTPQLTEAETGFGLGFSIGEFREHKRVSHSGAVYGFSSSFVAIPELKVGVVVLANEDITMGPVRRIANLALGWMVETRLGKPLTDEEVCGQVPEETARALVGDFESRSFWAELCFTDGRLSANISGEPVDVVQSPDGDLLLDGRSRYRSKLELTRNEKGDITGFQTGGQTFRRVDSDAVQPIPTAWQRFLGSYGPEFIPLVVSCRHGHLYAMTENMVDYRLTPLNRTVFKMPPGMYEDEQVVFHPGPDGRVHSAVLAGMVLPVRGQETED